MKGKIFIILAIVFIGIFIFGYYSCTAKKKVYTFKADCDGQAFVLNIIEKKQYATSYYILQFNFGNLPAIDIKASDITDIGAPYRKDLYGDAPFVIFDSVQRFVNTKIPEDSEFEQSVPRNLYVMYIDPKVYSKSDFDNITKCLAQQRFAMEEALDKDFINTQHHLNFPQLMMAVYGTEADFTKEYADGNTILKIRPDGAIRAWHKKDMQNPIVYAWIDTDQNICVVNSELEKLGITALDNLIEVKTKSALKTDFKIKIVENRPEPKWSIYKNQITKTNLASFWQSGRQIDKLETYTIPEPVGAIGDNFQRFYIHFTKIEKDTSASNTYKVYGKTRIENNIKSFEGTFIINPESIRVLQASSYDDAYLNGSFEVTFSLDEDKNQNGAGTYEGKMITNWYMDANGNIEYNNLDMPDIINNQATGQFKEYATGKVQKVAWGEGIIPNSSAYILKGDAVGEWRIKPAYEQYGWQQYNRLFSFSTQETETAHKEEIREWWK